MWWETMSGLEYMASSNQRFNICSCSLAFSYPMSPVSRSFALRAHDHIRRFFSNIDEEFAPVEPSHES